MNIDELLNPTDPEKGWNLGVPFEFKNGNELPPSTSLLETFESDKDKFVRDPGQKRVTSLQHFSDSSWESSRSSEESSDSSWEPSRSSEESSDPSWKSLKFTNRQESPPPQHQRTIDSKTKKQLELLEKNFGHSLRCGSRSNVGSFFDLYREWNQGNLCQVAKRFGFACPTDLSKFLLKQQLKVNKNFSPAFNVRHLFPACKRNIPPSFKSTAEAPNSDDSDETFVQKAIPYWNEHYPAERLKDCGRIVELWRKHNGNFSKIAEEMGVTVNNLKGAFFDARQPRLRCKEAKKLACIANRLFPKRKRDSQKLCLREKERTPKRNSYDNVASLEQQGRLRRKKNRLVT